MRLKPFLYTIPLGLRSLLGRQGVEHEPDGELQDHFRRKMGVNLSSGREEAHRAAGAISWGSSNARRSAGTCAA
jgi:hypothetical protein